MKKLNKLALTSLLFLTGCNVKENINKFLSKKEKNKIIINNANSPIDDSDKTINIEEELKQFNEEILKLSKKRDNESPFFCNMRLYILNTLRNSRKKIEKGEVKTTTIMTYAYLDFLMEHEEEFKEYIETTIENKEEPSDSSSN